MKIEKCIKILKYIKTENEFKKMEHHQHIKYLNMSLSENNENIKNNEISKPLLKIFRTYVY